MRCCGPSCVRHHTRSPVVPRVTGSEVSGSSVLGGIFPTLPWVLRRLLLVAVLLGLVPAVAADAHHTPGFDFEGAGWGHGVGMSQWGAYGQALEDPTKPGEEIAAYYYPGSEPATMRDLALPNDLLHTLDNPLWVNLGSQITLLEFTAVGGPLDLCLEGDGEGPCPKPEHPQADERWEFRRIARNECGFFHGGELQGTPGSCRAAIAWPDADGVRLRHGAERSKLCASRTSEVCEYRHGELKIRDDPVELGFHVVLAVGLEEYLRGVAEVLDHWDAAGVNEAQAITARSYTAFKFFQWETGRRPENPNVDPGISGARKDRCWCHVYDDTRDINYIGWAKETRSNGQPWLDGVEATSDRVLTYFGDDSARFTKAGIVQAFFSASSGGFTRSNVYGFFTEWNGRPPAVREWPYLRPVEDPWDVDPSVGNPHAAWEKRVSASDVARWLGWEDVTEASLLVGPSVASPAHVRFVGVLDDEPESVTVSGARLRTALGLRSSNITAIDGVEPDGSERVDHEDTTPVSDVEDPTLDVGNDGENLDTSFDIVPNFPDAVDSVHADAIQAIRQQSITLGCGDGFYFCPSDVVTRAEMATFLRRALKLEEVQGNRFSDVPSGHTHSGSIYAIAELGITSGCRDGTRYCPNDPTTRGAMAAFLARALDLEPGKGPQGEGFADVPETHPFRSEIYAIAEQGITVGCKEGRFCPEAPVTRAAMATFLARAFIWKGTSPPGSDQ